MTPQADQLLTIALKKIDLRGGFSPAELGRRVGLSRLEAETAARALANAGVLVLGFDHSAHFSDDFRKSKTAQAPPKKKPRRSAKASAAE